ncbi:helix-turn-helix domain-containing protein [Tepidanaerobacter syntrophicus]|uniref:Transcriptional regulator with XRE-family HTH domain n=1 Tax=Tepidanaerobacter syntrophicus TaxID=224999 RepID=A0A0U9HBW3_9FIRM|nr:helix-turn-helix transcriptional regulator [Tepidanaerobacter syntrophicus]GAQ24256.1 transcriptional regulator with XRE-family HTH domain [Tepidanaerobacter syntrophicus]
MLGDNIRKIRKSLGISINKLSKLSGLSLGYLSDLENNKSLNPTKETLDKIAKALGVPTEKLLTNDSTNEISYDDIKITNPDIRAIARAGEKLTPKEAEDLRRLAERLFPNAFKHTTK